MLLLPRSHRCELQYLRNAKSFLVSVLISVKISLTSSNTTSCQNVSAKGLVLRYEINEYQELIILKYSGVKFDSSLEFDQSN